MSPRQHSIRFQSLHFGNLVLANFCVFVYYIYCVVITLLWLFMSDQLKTRCRFLYNWCFLSYTKVRNYFVSFHCRVIRQQQSSCLNDSSLPVAMWQTPIMGRKCSLKCLLKIISHTCTWTVWITGIEVKWKLMRHLKIEHEISSHQTAIAKLPLTTRGYCIVKFAHLNNAFSYFFELEASPVENQSL